MTPEQQIQQLQRKLNTKEYLLNVASNSSDYFEQQMQLAQAERDALQARVDGALAALQESKQPALGQSFWRAVDKMVADQNKAIKILTGEGE